MYNDFVLIGPKSDREVLKVNSILKSLKLIKKRKTILSRGDDSGTHKKNIHYGK